MNSVPVLDKGYVRLVDHMGSDLSVVNAARASFAKESHWLMGEDDTPRLQEKDRRLINFLVREGHGSPFRHAFVTLEVKAPLFVARQWWKYVVGSDHTMDGWNEMSFRYVEGGQDGLEFYFPDSFRSAPKNRKQGSGHNVDPLVNEHAKNWLGGLYEHVTEIYYNMLNSGVAAEQARMVLPMSTYTVWRWSASLQSLAHFLSERLESSAQQEIRQYAKAVYQLIYPLYPESIAAMIGGTEKYEQE